LRKYNEKEMKKQAVLIFAVIAGAAFLAACKGKTEAPRQSADAPVPVSLMAEKKEAAARSAVKKGEYKVTLVELGSVRCVPCRMMMPILDELEKEYEGELRIVFHDVWTQEGRPYAEKYGIRGIPTQVFLDSDGKEFFRNVGFFPKDRILEVIKTKGIRIK